MTHKQTTLRHVWLAGLGMMARVRRTMDRIAGRAEIQPEDSTPPVVEFVTTHKPAKRVPSSPSSGSRRAGERESQRRIAGKGR
jgi:hypothetical protein